MERVAVSPVWGLQLLTSLIAWVSFACSWDFIFTACLASNAGAARTVNCSVVVDYSLPGCPSAAADRGQGQFSNPIYANYTPSQCTKCHSEYKEWVTPANVPSCGVDDSALTAYAFRNCDGLAPDACNGIVLSCFAAGRDACELHHPGFFWMLANYFWFDFPIPPVEGESISLTRFAYLMMAGGKLSRFLLQFALQSVGYYMFKFNFTLQLLFAMTLAVFLTAGVWSVDFSARVSLLRVTQFLFLVTQGLIIAITDSDVLNLGQGLEMILRSTNVVCILSVVGHLVSGVLNLVQLLASFTTCTRTVTTRAELINQHVTVSSIHYS